MRPGRWFGLFSPGGALRALTGLGAVVGVGCTSVSQNGTQSALMQATQSKASVLSLRATQNVLAIQVPGTFEVAADKIAAQAPDAKVRRRALLAKIELVPAFYQALFNADPLAGALDTYTLCIQVEAYFETGPGRDELAPLQAIALDAAKRARAQVETALKAVAKSSDGFERAKAFAEKWASAHPITGLLLSSRPSVLVDLAQMAAKGDQDVSVFQVVGDLPATVDDIATRLDIYAAYLPKAGRWQAELLVDELSDRTEGQRVLATFLAVQQMADRINQLVSPEALQHTLDVASADVSRERALALANVETLRQEGQAYVTSEREAALAAVGAERRLLMEDVERQRSALMQQVDTLRKQTVQDADALATRIIWRGAFAVAFLLVLAAVLTTLVLRLAQKRPAEGGRPGEASGASPPRAG